MLPQILVRDLIAYVVSWLIIRRTQSLSGNVCPQVLFIGIPVPFRELMYAFGDYVVKAQIIQPEFVVLHV